MPVGLVLFLALFRSSHYRRLDHKYFNDVTHLNPEAICLYLYNSNVKNDVTKCNIALFFLFEINFKLFSLLFIIMSTKSDMYQLNALERHVFIWFTKIVGKLEYTKPSKTYYTYFSMWKILKIYQISKLSSKLNYFH